MRNIERIGQRSRHVCLHLTSALVLIVCALVLGGCQQYICNNGVAQRGAPSVSSIFCIACNDGYALIDGACLQHGAYICDNGTPTAGVPPGTSNIVRCARCDDRFVMENGICRQVRHTCENGAPAGGAPSGNHDEERCARCDDGYVFDESGATAICRDPIYICPHGTPVADTPSDGGRDVEQCAMCASGYHLFTARCRSVSAIVANDGMANDQFGVTVAIDEAGNRAIIGAYFDDDDDNGSASGSAYIFTRSGTTWTQEARITASDGEENDQFGIAVAIDAAGDRVIVGAWADDDDDNGNNAGSAYIFTRSGAAWNEEEKIIASDGAPEDLFGVAVAIDAAGNRAIIGAYFDDDDDDDNGNESGSAYIFSRSGTAWTEEQKIIAMDRAADDQFGVAVSIDAPGDRVIVGAWADDDDGNGNNSGSAYIFTRSGTTWTQEARITASDGAENDQFGIAVALDEAGNRAIIGAYLDNDDNNENNVGSAYIFTRGGTAWTEEQKIIAVDGAANDQFGRAVDIDAAGDRAIIGAWGDADNGDGTGSAYMFSRSGTAWTEEQKIIAVDGAANDQFGIAVAIDAAGDRVVIGAFNDGEDNSGSAYIYDVP